MRPTISNRSITINLNETDLSAEQIRDEIQKMTDCNVVVNGDTWNDTLTGAPVAMITVVKIEQSSYAKIRNRKFLRTLKKSGAIRNW